jgi:uncharacterized protein
MESIESLCRRALAHQAGDAAHDLSHVERVVSNARRLASIEGARWEIVEPAAWLHDCVIVPKDSPDRVNASRLAAAQAVIWLREWGYAESLLSSIVHAIEAHSFSAKIPPETIEAKVVQDADRLDALGAVGLSRCLMLGGELRRPLYAANDPFCERRFPDDSRATLDHFYTKLLTLHLTMQTESGRAEAQRRTEFLKTFLAELRREIT